MEVVRIINENFTQSDYCIGDRILEREFEYHNGEIETIDFDSNKERSLKTIFNPNNHTYRVFTYYGDDEYELTKDEIEEYI